MRTFCVLCSFFVTLGSARGDDSAVRIAALVAAGESLLSREAALVREAPAREAEVDAMIAATGATWTVDQHAFQDGVGRLLDHYRDMTPEVRRGITDLVRFDDEMINGMTALKLCNRIEAAWEVALASQFLNHAEGDLKGDVGLGWSPDRRSDPKVQGGCR